MRSMSLYLIKLVGLGVWVNIDRSSCHNGLEWAINITGPNLVTSFNCAPIN